MLNRTIFLFSLSWSILKSGHRISLYNFILQKLRKTRPTVETVIPFRKNMVPQTTVYLVDYIEEKENPELQNIRISNLPGEEKIRFWKN